VTRAPSRPTPAHDIPQNGRTLRIGVRWTLWGQGPTIPGLATRVNQENSDMKKVSHDSAPAAEQTARVLIVDDEPGIRQYVERVLTTAGYRTTVAADCTEAIAIAARSKFDLLLTDVMMPDMTGAALAGKIREGDPDLKVLYLTGHPDSLFDEKLVLLLEEAFLEKPCTASGLRQAVSQAINGSVSIVAAPTIVDA